MDKILATEWSNDFEMKRKRAMAMSYYKYGPVVDNYEKHNKSEGFLDAVANATRRIKRYEETGNTEFLVDAANFCMIEFMYPQHDKAHFKSTDSGACETIGFGKNEVLDYEEQT